MFVAQEQMEHARKPLRAQLCVWNDVAPPGLCLERPRQCLGDFQIVRWL
jgi:hypothetical protein